MMFQSIFIVKDLLCLNFIFHHLLRPGIYTLGLGSHSLKDEYSWNDSMFDFEVIEMFDDSK